MNDHGQHIYRSAFFRGGAVLMSALSGVDHALWDIAGKHNGVPVYIPKTWFLRTSPTVMLIVAKQNLV